MDDFNLDLPEDFPATMAMGAFIPEHAPDYRYWLARVWDLELPILVWVMLNPSTADAALDDPTIRRCMSFARDTGHGGILVVNLFARRTKSPEVMRAADDPIGPDNDVWLMRAFKRAAETGGKVVAAWGVHGQFQDRDYAVANLADRAGVTLLCLGKTQGGDPRHPLYVKGGTAFTPLREAA